MDHANNNLPPWQRQVVELQQSFRQTLSDRKYDHFTDRDIVTLKKELGYAILGEPPQNRGYGRVETSLIDEVFQFIRHVNKGAEDYYISFVFVVCCTSQEQYLRPVFRVNCCGEVNCDKIHSYVDDTPRFYKSWEHYLDTNLLAECIMVYPSAGSYWRPANGNRAFQLRYRYSPAHNIGNQFRSCLDAASPIIGAVTSIICLASKCSIPISARILANAEVASVAWNVVNTYSSFNKLLDRSKHRQSLSPTDPRVRNCYLNVAAGVTWAVASLGLLQLNGMAVLGQSMTLEMRRVIKRGAIVTVLVGGGRVVNCLFNVRRKRRNGEAVIGEVGNFIASSHSFYDTIVTAQRISTLVDLLFNNNNIRLSSASRIQNLIHNRIKSLLPFIF